MEGHRLVSGAIERSRSIPYRPPAQTAFGPSCSIQALVLVGAWWRTKGVMRDRGSGEQSRCGGE